MSQSKISRIERGKTLPSVADVERIAKALSLPADQAEKMAGKITSGKARGGLELPALLLGIENCRRPVVMAIHGTPAGGVRDAKKREQTEVYSTQSVAPC